MLFALGLGGDVVGVTHECDYPAAASRLPHLTATVLPDGLSAGEVDAASTYSRPGPRLVNGTELLAHLFHPDRVEPPAGIDFAALH